MSEYESVKFKVTQEVYERSDLRSKVGHSTRYKVYMALDMEVWEALFERVALAAMYYYLQEARR